MTQGSISTPASTGSLLRLANDGIDQLVAVRRDLHAHPELGFEEVRTSALVAAQLAEWGVSDVTPLGGTGLVATVHGSRPGTR
ncbi:MAG: hypothetical protein WDA15_06065, partial [Trueperaceae bacterium]